MGTDFFWFEFSFEKRGKANDLKRTMGIWNAGKNGEKKFLIRLFYELKLVLTFTKSFIS